MGVSDSSITNKTDCEVSNTWSAVGAVVIHQLTMKQIAPVHGLAQEDSNGSLLT